MECVRRRGRGKGAYMINLLMRNAPVVLQHVVILCSRRFDEFLYHRLQFMSALILKLTRIPLSASLSVSSTFNLGTRAGIRN
jgi:hypothetical protein